MQHKGKVELIMVCIWKLGDLYLLYKNFINHLLIILLFSFTAHLSVCGCYPNPIFPMNRLHLITLHCLSLSFYFIFGYFLFYSHSLFTFIFLAKKFCVYLAFLCLSFFISNYQNYPIFHYYYYFLCLLFLLEVSFFCMHFLLTNLFPIVSFLSLTFISLITLFLSLPTFSVAISNRFSLSQFFAHSLFFPI